MQVFGRLVLLFCAGMLLLPAPYAHAVAPPSLDQVLKGAEELRDGDLDELLNRQLDKAERDERAGKGKQPVLTETDQLRDGNLETLLNRQLDNVEQDDKQKPVEKDVTVGQDAPAGNGKPLQTPSAKNVTAKQEDNGGADQDLTEEDVTKAYRKVVETARKETGNPLRISGSLFVIIVLGAALALIIICVNIARFTAYRISCAINQCDRGRPLTQTDVHYSWYYRDAIARFPPPRTSHRR